MSDLVGGGKRDVRRLAEIRTRLEAAMPWSAHWNGCRLSDAGAILIAHAPEDIEFLTEVASRAAARIAALESALHEVCENAYLTGTDPDWSPCAVKAEIIERARVVLGAPKP